MNILAFNHTGMKKITIYLALFLISFTSCKKDKDEVVAYDIAEQKVSKTQGEKINQKTDQEYVSILFSDLFDEPITNNDLTTIANVTASFGDKTVINEMLVQNFLNEPGVKIPTNDAMRADPDKFIRDMYRKFLTREPNEFESYYIKDLIVKNEDITPEVLYYSIVTCNEYLFY